MKTKLSVMIMICFSVVLFAQKKDNMKNQIDIKLVGSWKGEEDDQQIAGMHKSWIMHRTDDGKFLLLFVAVQDGKTTTFTEKGQWWVEDGKFYELHKADGKTDVYDYQVIDKDHVKFKASQMSLEQNNENYEFIDTRIEE
ncbi:hypothetical protein ACQWU4_07300 [Chryseobacterium sp. MIQD13]|uniref:hypothetical protein n=1 Tax=Chryseobacterium sp. MIQD13 TaxID=3422310 RepID=UPI003D2B61D6